MEYKNQNVSGIKERKSKRDSGSASAFSSTLPASIRIKVNGTIISQEDFFKTYINGFKWNLSTS